MNYPHVCMWSTVHLMTLSSPCVRPVIAGFVVAPTQTQPDLACRGEYFVLSQSYFKLTKPMIKPREDS